MYLSLLKSPPPAVYCPEAATSLVDVYTVVEEFRVAAEVYRANLKTSPPDVKIMITF
jgi:2-keto-4-pentenoate hydratase